MKVTLTNNTAAAISVDLPDGGVVPANGTLTIENIDSPRLEQAMRSRLDSDGNVVQAGIDAHLDSGDLSIDLRPDDDGGSVNDLSDLGARVYQRTFTVTHDNLTAAATSETVEDIAANAFPARARLRGYRFDLDEVFAGGSVSACTVDIGIAAGEADVLSDGTNVFTGASTGETFGSGTNCISTQPVDLGGKRLRVLVAATDDNVDALTTGELTVIVDYTIH